MTVCEGADGKTSVCRVLRLHRIRAAIISSLVLEGMAFVRGLNDKSRRFPGSVRPWTFCPVRRAGLPARRPSGVLTVLGKTGRRDCSICARRVRARSPGRGDSLTSASTRSPSTRCRRAPVSAGRAAGAIVDRFSDRASGRSGLLHRANVGALLERQEHHVRVQMAPLRIRKSGPDHHASRRGGTAAPYPPSLPRSGPAGGGPILRTLTPANVEQAMLPASL